MRCWRALLAVMAAALLLPATASAAALIPLAPASSWGGEPVHAASPPGDPRLFVVERSGAIRIVKSGVLEPTPFLTVENVDTFSERGLLSIAFAPDYATSGLFYVFTVAAGSDDLDPTGQAGDIRIVEYRRSAEDPDLADPASARIVLKLPHSAGNHNGGQIAFGPEGLLYVTLGDNAISANAQDLANLYGKILRIDPRDPPGEAGYSIPASNPFLPSPGARPEIYALGLRNPYRASFSPGGDLIIGDVGDGTWEEIDVGRATGTPAATTLAEANLGWPICEGLCTPPNGALMDPFFQYPNDSDPPETTGCAVLGGNVVRDPGLPGLSGRYLYGDLCRDDLRTLDLGVGGGDPRPAGLSIPDGSLRGFGEDSRGCLYVLTTATAYRMADSPDAGTACPEGPPNSSPQPPVVDGRPPGLTLGGARRQKLRRYVSVLATCDEACDLRATGALRFLGASASKVARLKSATKPGLPGADVLLRLRLTRGVLRRAKRARGNNRRVKAIVSVTATDTSGNQARGSTRILLR